MKTIMMTVRLWWFYLTYKGIKTIEIRKRFAKDFKGKIFEYVSKTNWKQDLMKIPAKERDFFKQFVGKVGLCFECDKVDEFYDFDDDLCEQACLDRGGMLAYLGDKKGYAIHITKLEIFDKPKEISEFYKVGFKKEYNQAVFCLKNNVRWKTEPDYIIEDCQLTRAPQSYCYIEV